MLSNAYFLAKFRFDTAENEPAKNFQTSCKICKNSANVAGRFGRAGQAAGAVALAVAAGPPAAWARAPEDAVAAGRLKGSSGEGSNH